MPIGHWLGPDLGALSLVAERCWICTQSLPLVVSLATWEQIINVIGTAWSSSRGQVVETKSLSLTNTVSMTESPRVHPQGFVSSVHEHCLAETEYCIGFVSGTM